VRRPTYSKPKQKCVAYYRISRKRNGKSRFNLLAQRDMVDKLVEKKKHQILAEFIENDSGKKNDFPELEKAIATAKKNDAILLIAKIDRLYRNVSFVSKLWDEKTKFVCCDIPHVNELTIHTVVSIAQFEHERISERIKRALKAKRKREPNWKPGTSQNLTDKARKKGHSSLKRKANESMVNREAYKFIKPRCKDGMSYEKIARELNKEGYRTRRGKKFRSWQVWNIYKRFENENI